jgi:hypothetical protein
MLVAQPLGISEGNLAAVEKPESVGTCVRENRCATDRSCGVFAAVQPPWLTSCPAPAGSFLHTLWFLWHLLPCSCRPVLKHGPRSPTCTRVSELLLKASMLNEREGSHERADGGSLVIALLVWDGRGALRGHQGRNCRPGAPRAYTLGPERW